MTTALTAYLSSAASTTLSTANKLYTLSGTPTIVDNDTLIGTQTGWIELYSQGNASLQTPGGSIGSPSGHGFFLDTSVLDGQVFLGTTNGWSGAIRSGLKSSGDTCTVTYVVRAYRYHSGTYTQIASMTTASQNFTTSSGVNISVPATTGTSGISFATGDKLYIDVWANVTVAATLSTQKLRLDHLSTDTSGLTGDANANIVTPGYQPASIVNITETATGTETVSAIPVVSNVAEYDSFIRSSTSNGWGVATDGDTWYNRQGSNASLSTNGTVGQLVNSASARSHITLGDTDNTDQEITVQITPYATADDFGCNARMTGDATINGVNGYRFHYNGSSGLVLFKITAGTGVQVGSTVSRTITASTSYSFRFRAVGPDNSVHLQGRMWATSTTEPGTWDIDQTDTSGFASGAGGLTGIASSTTNAIQYSNFALANVTATNVVNVVEDANPGTGIAGAATIVTISITEQENPATGSTQAIQIAFVTISETPLGSEIASTFSFNLVIASVTETVILTEIVTTATPVVSPPTAQMMLSDLNNQYSRIMGTAAGSSIKILATTYYGNSTNNQLIYGELDALLKPESISQLHVMRTINDVTNFLKSYEYQTNVLADAPIAYYPLNEASGAVAYDIAGNKYNGLINTSVVLGQPGALSISPDTSMQFSAGAYVTLPGAVNTANWNALTVEVWINPVNAAPGYTARILSNDTPSTANKGVELAVTASGLYFAIGTGAAYTLFNPAYTFSTSSWYHLVAVYAYANMYLYINGVQVATQAGPSLPIAITTNPFYISKAPTTTTEGYPGYIDEIAIYNTALSPARVAAHYQAGINPT